MLQRLFFRFIITQVGNQMRFTSFWSQKVPNFSPASICIVAVDHNTAKPIYQSGQQNDRNIYLKVLKRRKAFKHKEKTNVTYMWDCGKNLDIISSNYHFEKYKH